MTFIIIQWTDEGVEVKLTLCGWILVMGVIVALSS